MHDTVANGVEYLAFPRSVRRAFVMIPLGRLRSMKLERALKEAYPCTAFKAPLRTLSGEAPLETPLYVAHVDVVI